LAGSDPTQIENALYGFRDFVEFLASFREICRYLRSPEDYLAVWEDLESYLVSEKIFYSEVLYTPSIPWKFGFDGEEILDALTIRSAEFERRSGIVVRWILDNVRQFGRGPAERTAELAHRYSSRGVVAVGLGGDERSFPATEFEEVFAWARAYGLYVHIHAGEVGGPEEVWEALTILGANRIGHGIQAARDSKLMEYLRDRTVGLDVCLTSNVRTRAWPVLRDHPFHLLFRRGVPVSLSTDDPGLFRTTLTREFQKAVETFQLGEADLTTLVLQGVRSSFLPHDAKMTMMQQLNDRLRRGESEMGNRAEAGA